VTLVFATEQTVGSFVGATATVRLSSLLGELLVVSFGSNFVLGLDASLNLLDSFEKNDNLSRIHMT